MTLGERIRQEREARGWSQAELAGRVGGVTSQYISMLEKGKRANPTRELLRQLAKEFGISVAELEGEDDILAGPWPAATMQALGLTDAFLVRYRNLWPDLNREQRAWVVGHLRIMADAERKIRALEGRAPRGEPDSAPEAGGHLEIIPGCV
jgi:transcriptional regulator with XRE-family HTH domain